jgi:acyl-CoA dehydrogenase
MLAKPDKSQRKDIDFLMALGELFTLVVYGQLVLENAKIYAVDDDTIDQIFDFMVRDFSSHALQLYSKSSATMSQMRLCSMMIKKPTVDRTRFDRVWSDQIFPLKDRYVMKP